MKMTVKELLEQLKEAQEALNSFRPEVDALLGALGEFYYETPDENDAKRYSEEFLDGLEELAKIYDSLPTWSEVDDLEKTVVDMIKELEE